MSPEKKQRIKWAIIVGLLIVIAPFIKLVFIATENLSNKIFKDIFPAQQVVLQIPLKDETLL